MNIWEAYSAESQAQQHPRLCKALQSLSDAVAQLDKAVSLATTADSHSAQLFSRFLETDAAPAWPEVRAALEKLFGNTEKTRIESIEGGAKGTTLVVRTLNRTIGFEEDIVAFKRWVNELDSAVTAAEEKAVKQRSSRASSVSQAAPPLPSSTPSVQRKQQPPPPASDLPVPFTSLPSAPRPRPRTTSSPLEAKGRAPTGSIDTTVLSDSDEKAEGEEDTTPQRKKRKTEGKEGSARAQVTKTDAARRGEKLRAEEKREEAVNMDKQSTVESKKEGVRYRSGRLGRTLGQEKVAGGEEKAAGLKVDEGKESDLTEVEESFDDQPPAVSSTPSTRNTPSASFELLALFPKILTSLPSDLLLTLRPPVSLTSYLSAHPSLDLAFRRPEGKNRPDLNQSRGIAGGEYFAHKNWIRVDPTQNICADFPYSGEKNTIKPGQPIILVSTAKKLRDVVEVLPTGYHDDKVKSGAQVFVKEDEERWTYKGKYILAWDGSENEMAEPLDRWGWGWNGLHSLLRSAILGHLSAKTIGWRAEILTDWGFEARTFEAMKRELNEAAGMDGEGRKEGGSRRKRVMRYLVLRCVGFDEECFKVWQKRRAEGKKEK